MDVLIFSSISSGLFFLEVEQGLSLIDSACAATAGNLY